MAQKMIDLAREQKTEKSKDDKIELNPYYPYGCRFEWLCATEWPCHIKYDEESWEEAYIRKNAELEDVNLIYNNKYCQMMKMELSPLKDSERPWLEEYDESPVTKKSNINKKKDAARKLTIKSPVKENKLESPLPGYRIPKRVVATSSLVDSILEGAKLTPQSFGQIKTLINPVKPKVYSSSMRIVSKAIGMLRSEHTTMKGLDLISSMKKQLNNDMIEKTGLVKYVKRVQSIPQFSRFADLLLVELSEISYRRASSCSSVTSSSSDSL